MITPTYFQMKTLRLMAAGAELRPADLTQSALVINGVAVARVRTKNVQRMVDAQWIVRRGDLYALTPLGRQQANVRTFVRAFAEGL